MIKKNIRIKLTSLREASNDHFFDSLLEDDVDMFEEHELHIEDEEPEGPIEMYSEGELYITDERVIIAYDESELTGMEGSHTQVRFERAQDGLVTMMRSGSVNTILVFEEGKRHICAYQTQYMPFEICVFTKSVKNTLLEDGKIELDYIVEIRGAQAERTQFKIEVFEQPDLI
ncbi:MAG: DUF1934 domain-containing protein [Clostridia bacterium]|nr:DUF1934 domain-containing protein [Clostridia bacterium]